jgi:hypothetical protein
MWSTGEQMDCFAKPGGRDSLIQDSKKQYPMVSVICRWTRGYILLTLIVQHYCSLYFSKHSPYKKMFKIKLYVLMRFVRILQNTEYNDPFLRESIKSDLSKVYTWPIWKETIHLPDPQYKISSKSIHYFRRSCIQTSMTSNLCSNLMYECCLILTTEEGHSI